MASRQTETRPERPPDLREACVAEALAIIAEEGVEKLSLREVSRRLGVSHQAPYKHFESRDHILAEVIARAYDDFARHLEARPPATEPFADLEAMGRAYMDYAVRHPLHYRLMFGTPLPDPSRHPAMMEKARHAFDLLRDRLASMDLRPVHDGTAPPFDDALFIWSCLHGLAGILQSDALCGLDPAAPDPARVIGHVMARLGLALRPER
ncbi:TetR/AcrR family transcriptional regulator [Chthonobacter rhizosphaerae]|uniref:TetR/AcrR family transcriptional regulator n=1 Tax=Chthonobacter rhizosphaerae TaxID=2735553 RepID=UPI0015EF594B|nr:TetR/AcrR family transcriptional regulator [Chthonobacter rhizosphaerae]